MSGNRPGPAAFKFRLDKQEREVSTHWLEFFLPTGTHEEKLVPIRALIQSKRVPELTLDKKHLFVLVPVAALRRLRDDLEGTRTRFLCKYTPRFGYNEDSHSSIFPVPGVENWPADDDGAYHLAVQKALADQALEGSYKCLLPK